MGQTACTDCTPRTDHSEMRMQESMDEVVLTPAYRLKPSPVQSSLPVMSLHPLIRLQSLWKGYQARSQYAILRREARRFREYFCCSEVSETLRSGQIVSNSRETRRHIYRSGGDYEGEWKGGFRDGQGKMTYRDGSVYEGKWSYGYPAGQGCFRHFDGDTYSGNWTFPYPDVRSSIIVVGKETIARWRSGLINGYGNFHTEWLAYKTSMDFLAKTHIDMPRNRLEAIKAKLALIREMLAQTKITAVSRSLPPHSAVVFRNKKGGVYKGSARGEEREGYGEMTWVNGDVYRGEWKGNVQEGWGVSQWSDGSSYVGTYAGNKKDGIGEYIWSDGKRFVGQWKANLMHGIGEHIWPDGRCYLGEWSQGELNGYGRLTKDQQHFEGFWKQGKAKKAVANVVSS